MRLLVTGQPGVVDYELVARKLDSLTRLNKETTVLVYAGDEVGRLATRWAYERRHPWSVYYEGEDPLADADGLVVFRRGQDKATNSLIVKATSANVKIRVVELK